MINPIPKQKKKYHIKRNLLEITIIKNGKIVSVLREIPRLNGASFKEGI